MTPVRYAWMWLKSNYPQVDSYWNTTWDRLGRTLVSTILVNYRHVPALRVQFCDGDRIVISMPKQNDRHITTNLADPRSFDLIKQELDEAMK